MLVQSIFQCARCGGTHVELEFKLLHNLIVDNDGTVWNYWTLCPETGEPILLRAASGYRKIDDKEYYCEK